MRRRRRLIAGPMSSILYGHMDDNRQSGSAVVMSDRWRLARLDRGEWMGIGLSAAIVGLLFAMFHFLGNTVADAGGRSAFLWMYARWQDKISFGGADYSHGVIIPFVSLLAVWYKRHDLMAAPRSINASGLVLIVMALAMHWIGAKMRSGNAITSRKFRGMQNTR